jgi:ferritin-like metal-binding protein YciE
MPIASVRELTTHELSELYDAEHRFLEEQSVMVNKATDQELQKAIENHIYQTRQHIRNLEQFFRELGQEPRRETNEVARRLVSKARQDIQEAQNDLIRDCAIVAAVIKVEHFEIASYRALISGARLMMGQSMAMNPLNENLRQEEETARTAEQSAEELIQKAMQAEAPVGEGPIDLMARVRDKLKAVEVKDKSEDEPKGREGEREKALLVEKVEEVADKLRGQDAKRAEKKPEDDK